MSFGVAVKAFFSALTNKEISAKIEDVLVGNKSEVLLSEVSIEASKAPGTIERREEGRSEGLELLATLQREARFVDFVKEPLDNFTDEVVGATARLVHDRCAETLERCFGIRPLSTVPEGETTTLSETEASNGARVKLGGTLGKQKSLVGRVANSGWIASKCSLPKWSGAKDDEMVLAPMEIDA